MTSKMFTKLITLERFLKSKNQGNDSANILALIQNIALAAKVISKEVNSAGLTDILGLAGIKNIQDEDVKKLDILTNETIKNILLDSGYVCVIASEEDESFINAADDGEYVVLTDPLDGSANTDIAAPVGTIFSIYKKITVKGQAGLKDCLQSGTKQICAGYILYGSSTIMVLSTGNGVHGFTLDPSIGEFLLSHEKMKIPNRGKHLSINMGNFKHWDEPTKKYITKVIHNGGVDDDLPNQYRYIGALAADFHRMLVYGGIFIYPLDTKNKSIPRGKLRLLYEANPIAFLAEQAGGVASTGVERILDIKPKSIHQRTAFVVGCKCYVEKYESFYG